MWTYLPFIIIQFNFIFESTALVKFDVLTAGNIKVIAVWNMRMLCTVCRSQCFVEPAAFIFRREETADYDLGCNAI